MTSQGETIKVTVNQEVVHLMILDTNSLNIKTRCIQKIRGLLLLRIMIDHPMVDLKESGILEVEVGVLLGSLIQGTMILVRGMMKDTVEMIGLQIGWKEAGPE